MPSFLFYLLVSFWICASFFGFMTAHHLFWMFGAISAHLKCLPNFQTWMRDVPQILCPLETGIVGHDSSTGGTEVGPLLSKACTWYRYLGPIVVQVDPMNITVLGRKLLTYLLICTNRRIESKRIGLSRHNDRDRKTWLVRSLRWRASRMMSTVPSVWLSKILGEDLLRHQ